MTTMTRDATVQATVRREFARDGRLAGTTIAGTVDGPVVTLTGTVDTYAQRLAAATVAHRVAGVLDVANDVHVRLTPRLVAPDRRIAQAVRRSLEEHVPLPAMSIHTTVVDGWVTL